MKIKKILKNKGVNVFTIGKNSPACEAISIFSEKKIGSLVVQDDSGKIEGIITEKDVIKCYKTGKTPDEIQIHELMTPADKLIICNEDDKIQYAMSMMTEHRIKHIPVMHKDKIIGIISIGDLVKAQLDESKQITKRLEDYISGAYPEE